MNDKLEDELNAAINALAKQFPGFEVGLVLVEQDGPHVIFRGKLRQPATMLRQLATVMRNRDLGLNRPENAGALH